VLEAVAAVFEVKVVAVAVVAVAVGAVAKVAIAAVMAVAVVAVAVATVVSRGGRGRRRWQAASIGSGVERKRRRLKNSGRNLAVSAESSGGRERRP
jgi:hypothetical protein